MDKSLLASPSRSSGGSEVAMTTHSRAGSVVSVVTKHPYEIVTDSTEFEVKPAWHQAFISWHSMVLRVSV